MATASDLTKSSLVIKLVSVPAAGTQHGHAEHAIRRCTGRRSTHTASASKAWEMELAGRVGAAIKARRNALKLTAVDLAERTKALGYPVNRVAISKIEGNLRAGKLDVAELLVLAAALHHVREHGALLLVVAANNDGMVPPPYLGRTFESRAKLETLLAMSPTSSASASTAKF